MLSFYDEYTYREIMKIALQLSGQIRFWEQSYEYWTELKYKLEQSGFDVDIHICGWEDSYTKSFDFSSFTTHNLIPINNDLLTTGQETWSSSSQGIMRRKQDPIGLMPFSYQQYWGSRYRRLYQKENNVQYDFIMVTRPDLWFKCDIVKILQDKKKEICESKCTVFIPFGVINTVGRKPVYPSRLCNDYMCLGTEESMNLYCNGFLHSYLQDSKSFISTNHTYPSMTCMKTNLLTKSITIPMKLRRLNDTIM
jgi:hypothetical protein